MRWWNRSGLGITVLCLVAALASAGDSAFARSAPKPKATAHRAPVVAALLPTKDAAILIDGASGRVLYERNADAVRKPASLTKMMTLYLLFEQLKAGTITLDSKLKASVHSASMEPTKLGLNPGEEVDVETAIKAITVLSANDVAVMIAERLGQTEAAFGQMMTNKARQLGMTKSNFHNASGLPDPLQATSAHDMALLGQHLAYDFPQYFPYFSVPYFSYDGRFYDSHDHVLGQFAGVDGIKTGYTRASGFNLVSSAVRSNKHIIGVVMGGMTYASRDAEMVRLLTGIFDFATQNPNVLADANAPWQGGKGPAISPFNAKLEPNVLLASLNLDPPAPVKNAPKNIVPTPVPAAPATLVAEAKPAPAPPPVLKVTLPVPKPERAPVVVAAVEAPKIAPRIPMLAAKNPMPLTIALNTPPAAPATRPAIQPAKPNTVIASAVPAPRERPVKEILQGGIASFPSFGIASAKAATTENSKLWTVQIGAFADQTLAESKLSDYAKLDAKLLGQAEHLISPFSSLNGHKLYRARFGLFEESQARTICDEMLKQKQNCFATAQLN